MSTKKHLINLFLLAAAVVSCVQKEEMAPPVEDAYAYRFKVADDALTKASYGEDHIVFDKDDLVASYALTSLNKSTPVEVAESGEKIITVRSSVALNAGDKVYAYYPHSSANDKASSTDVTLEIPRNQVSRDADAMPMVALPFTLTDAVNKYENTEVGTLEFVNLGSIIKLNIYSSDSKSQGETIENVTFIEEKPVAGSFTYDITNVDVENLEAISGYDETDVVVTGRATVGTSAEDAGVYYMVVAPGTYKGKFVVRTNKADYTYDSSAKEREYSRANVKPLNINLASTNWVANDKYDTSIDSPRELVAFLKDTSSDDTAEYTITADLDMTGYTITSASGFGGTLNGGDHTISNLVSSVPMFAENSGTISNLIIGETCTFSTTENVFGALVANDKGGTYVSVKNKANVTYTETSADKGAFNIDKAFLFGGLIGEISGNATLENCTNSGAVTIDVPSCALSASAIGGLVGYANGICSFSSCYNRGPVTINAIYINPDTPWARLKDADNCSIHFSMGGIVGNACTYTYNCNTNAATFTSCQNESAGVVTLNLSDQSRNDTDNNHGTGYINIGGIAGLVQGNINSSKNFADIIALAPVVKYGPKYSLRGCLMHVGGIAAHAWDGGLQFLSCTNEGNITVHSNNQRVETGNGCTVGGICGRGLNEGNTSTNYARYCSVKNCNINITGNGSMAVGGIYGREGNQIGNKVYSTASISYTGYDGYVGGITGIVEKCNGIGATIKSTWCEADITVDCTDSGSATRVYTGGLLGCWNSKDTGDYPCFTYRDSDGFPCHYSGNINTDGQTSPQSRTGMVLGYLASTQTVVFGESDAAKKIRVTGTLQRKDLLKTEITAANADDYKSGGSAGTLTIHVSSQMTPMKFMSFNIAVSQGKWATTKDPILEMLQDQKPDVVGLQEVNDLDVWDKLEAGGKQPWEFLTEGLSGYTGYRPDSKTNAILYNPEVFEASGEGYFYLGESGSNNSWDNYGTERTVLYMTLKHKKTGNYVFFINTHYPLGLEGQKKSSALIVERLAELNPNDYPIVLLGDLNNTLSSGAFDGTIKSIMNTAREWCDTADNKDLYTYNGWGEKPETDLHKVDHIWATTSTLYVHHYAVITQELVKYGDVEYLSDHYPIYSTISFR